MSVVGTVLVLSTLKVKVRTLKEKKVIFLGGKKFLASIPALPPLFFSLEILLIYLRLCQNGDERFFRYLTLLLGETYRRFLLDPFRGSSL